MIRLVLGGLLLAVFAVLLQVTSAEGPDAAFTAARTTWEREAPANYSFTLSTTAAVSGSTSTRITVGGGRLIAAVPSGGRAPAPVTLEGIWKRLTKDLREADRVTVTYDPVRGFPTLVQVDENLNAIDDEHSYAVSDVTVP